MNYDVDKLKEAIESSDSMQEACSKLGWHFNTFKTRAQKEGLYNPEKGWRTKSKPIPDKKDISEIQSRRGIKNRILKENLLSYVCCNCGLNEWNNKPISLHLDHINGKSEKSIIYRCLGYFGFMLKRNYLYFYRHNLC